MRVNLSVKVKVKVKVKEEDQDSSVFCHLHEHRHSDESMSLSRVDHGEVGMKELTAKRAFSKRQPARAGTGHGTTDIPPLIILANAKYISS